MTSVHLEAPARLHLGFLDPAATLGRRFGGLGLVIDGFAVALTLGAAARDATASQVEADAGVDADDRRRAAEALATLQRLHDRPAPLHLRLRRTLPAHAGFGSGTQLALAVGRAFAAWHGLDVPTPTLARQLGRGARSGIGIAGFDRGGLLVDGGRHADDAAAPLVAQVTLPAAWRVVVVQDRRARGLAGADEKQAIATLDPLPRAGAADLCHQVLLRVLPGASSGTFADVALGINALQQAMGAHFAPAQGGSAWTSASVGRLLEPMRGADGTRAAVGQSSWGPTGFALVASDADAQALLDEARRAGRLDAALDVRVVAPRAHGARWTAT